MTAQPTPLATLTERTQARLVQIGGDRAFRRRLMEMGFLPGTAIRMIRRVDVGGVLEVEVRRTRVTLRSSEAERLLVSTAGVFAV